MEKCPSTDFSVWVMVERGLRVSGFLLMFWNVFARNINVLFKFFFFNLTVKWPEFRTMLKGVNSEKVGVSVLSLYFLEPECFGYYPTVCMHVFFHQSNS